MRTRQAKDEVTIVIAAAVLQFLAVFLFGLLLLGWEQAFWPMLVAGVVSVRYLYRNRRP